MNFGGGFPGGFGGAGINVEDIFRMFAGGGGGKIFYNEMDLFIKYNIFIYFILN